MNKEEVLKFIKESNNLKLDLKKVLTDKSLNFSWIEFFILYYQYFGEEPWRNLEYVENGETYQKGRYFNLLDDYWHDIKININENKEIEFIYINYCMEEEFNKSTGNSVIKNLNLLLEMFEKLNKELISMDKNIEDFFGESDEVNEVDENEKIEDIDNKLV